MKSPPDIDSGGPIANWLTLPTQNYSEVLRS